MKATLTVAFIAMILVACEGGGTSSGRKAVDLFLTLDPITGPDCVNADGASTFETDTYLSIDCVWECANYKGQKEVYVSLDFEKDKKKNTPWVLDHEYFSSGICF